MDQMVTYEHIITDFAQLFFHFFSIFARHLLLPFGPFSLLFDGWDDPPGTPSGADNVLVGHRQQIPLFIGEFDSGLSDLFHGGGHIVIPFRLFRQFGPLNQFVLIVHYIDSRFTSKRFCINNISIAFNPIAVQWLDFRLEVHFNRKFKSIS